MNAKTVVAGQVNGLRFANRIVLNPLRVSRDTEFKMLRMMGLDRAYAWARFFILLVPVLFFVTALAVVFVMFGALILIAGLLAVNELSGRCYHVVKRPSVTSKRGLRNLMVQSEIVKLRDGERPPRITPLGKATIDAYGTTRKFRAPGSTTEAWVRKSDLLAGHCAVPASLFAVTQDVNDPPNVMTIWIGKPNGRRTREAITPLVCDFHEPFRIGQTLSGKTVLVNTFEFNTLIGGIPGMGKTATVRQFILRNLLDPEGKTYLVDGKGSKKDYRAAAHAYSGYIDGNDDDALDQVEAMLELLHAEINRANSNEETLKILLVLDEWQDIRAGADKDQLKRIDTLIIRIHKKGRATGFHLLLATQRASAVSIPTEMRSLFRQALAFRQKNGTDYGMVLGHAPDVDEPCEPGESIAMGDTGQTFTLVDHLSQDEWLTLAHRLTTRLTVDLRPAHEPDPLAQAIRESAHRLTVKTVSPTALYEALGGESRPGSAAVLGKFLAASGVDKRGAVYRVSDLLEAFGGN
jgi:hypothetical protein